MHFLSGRHRSEFLAVPQLVRFTMAQGSDGPEATLLIKSSTLTLKYLLRLKAFKLAIFRVLPNWLAYGVIIEDDSDAPALLWSVFECEDELDAIKALCSNSKCTIFLFNELAVNVAWTEAQIDIPIHHVAGLMAGASPHPSNDLTAASEVHRFHNALHRGELNSDEGRSFGPIAVEVWHPIESHYITNRITSSLISIFNTDEGRQQEEAALWLIDNLHPRGAVRSPQIYEESKVRELSDLLLSHEHGAFLIESKTLGIFARDSLPARKKLGRDIVKHLHKAARQLVGGVRNLRRGHKVTDLDGNEIEVERKQPPHIIVLVPDLSLLQDATEFGGKFFRSASNEAGAFFHILDPSELLRMVQAAEMISKRSVAVTPIMAFDYYLLKRAERAVMSETPNFGMLIRFQDSSPTASSADEADV